MTLPRPATVQSIRQQLLNRARDRNEDYQLTLVRYAVERFLYRLGRSQWADHYVVKGATLFEAWLNQPHRPTRDLDVTGEEAVDQERLETQIHEICDVSFPEDGLVFDLSGLAIEPIRRAHVGEGWRARFFARLGQAKIRLQLDVAFGDAVTPVPRVDDFPTLLPLPAPRVRLYPRETFVAEKFEAMVRLGRTNSRYKDFSDVAFLSTRIDFQGTLLRRACINTFEQRGTLMTPEDPRDVLRASFYSDDNRLRRWAAFQHENPTLEPLGSFRGVGELLITFLGPVWEAMEPSATWEGCWEPPGPWSARPTRPATE